MATVSSVYSFLATEEDFPSTLRNHYNAFSFTTQGLAEVASKVSQFLRANEHVCLRAKGTPYEGPIVKSLGEFYDVMRAKQQKLHTCLIAGFPEEYLEIVEQSSFGIPANIKKDREAMIKPRAAAARRVIDHQPAENEAQKVLMEACLKRIQENPIDEWDKDRRPLDARVKQLTEGAIPACLKQLKSLENQFQPSTGSCLVL